MKRLFLTAFVLLGLVFVSQAQTKHTIGEKFGGGIVFDVSADGLHGLIAETIDQGQANFEQAKGIAKSGKHSDAGKAFTDWYLPSKDELNKLFLQRTIVGGFTNNFYWSSTAGVEYGHAWYQRFVDGKQTTNLKPSTPGLVRAVRAF